MFKKVYRKITLLIFILLHSLSFDQSRPFVTHPSQLGSKAFEQWIGPSKGKEVL